MKHSISNTAKATISINNRTSTTKTTTGTWFFALFLIIVYALSLNYYYEASPYTSLLLPLLGLSVAALFVVALRATVVTWITVLVLLAFAGKRRRSLVREGRKITADVTMSLMKTVFKERSGLITFAFAILSFTALVHTRNAD